MVRPRGEKWYAAVSKVPDCFVEDKVMKNRPTEKSVVSIKFGGSRRGKVFFGKKPILRW